MNPLTDKDILLNICWPGAGSKEGIYTSEKKQRLNNIVNFSRCSKIFYEITHQFPFLKSFQEKMGRMGFPQEIDHYNWDQVVKNEYKRLSTLIKGTHTIAEVSPSLGGGGSLNFRNTVPVNTHAYPSLGGGCSKFYGSKSFLS